MIKKVVGYDEVGSKVFERSAREYDKEISKSVFGITLSDIFKVIPVFVLIITVYVNQQNFNVQILNMVNSNTSTIASVTSTLANLNNYLSASTGKQFQNGRPY